MSIPKNAPYLPPPYETADAIAIQACFEGHASPAQQLRAMNWICFRAAETDDMEYRTDPHDHAFASGRRFVGLQIRKLSGANIAHLRLTEGKDTPDSKSY